MEEGCLPIWYDNDSGRKGPFLWGSPYIRRYPYLLLSIGFLGPWFPSEKTVSSPQISRPSPLPGPREKSAIWCSSRENYFRSAGQSVWQALNALPDIVIHCRTFFSVHDQQILCFMPGIFVVFNPTGQNVRQCLSPLLDISRSLPDISDILVFREDYTNEFS